MAFDFHGGIAGSFWPGDRYVNWVGADGYNFPGKPWHSFRDIFQGAYHFASVHGKRMIIAETASPAADPRTAALDGRRGQVDPPPQLRPRRVVLRLHEPQGLQLRGRRRTASTLAAFRAWGLRRYFRRMILRPLAAADAAELLRILRDAARSRAGGTSPTRAFR